MYEYSGVSEPASSAEERRAEGCQNHAFTLSKNRTETQLEYVD